MKRIAVFCVTFHSDVELEHYKASLQKAAEKAQKWAEKHGTTRKATQNDINAFFG